MPGLFEQFPHTNLHELNLDWIINLLNQFKEDLENSAVLSVNGETGHVTLYESENVILPPLPEGVDQWRLVRLVNGQYVGILFYNGNAYIQRGNETMRLLTQEDIPSSSGVVSWNGLTGVVNVTGEDIPVDDTADADSIYQAITTEHTERVNADNALQNSINTLKSDVASKIFAGIASYDDLHQGGFSGRTTVNITFPSEMPHDNYYASAELNKAYADFTDISCYIFDKTTTGMTVTLIDKAAGSSIVDGLFRWVAIAK